MKGNFAFNRQTGNKFRNWETNYGSKTIALPTWREDPKINNREKIFQGALGIAHLKIMDKTSNTYSTNLTSGLNFGKMGNPQNPDLIQKV